ncbi:hypothetical protein CGMCC3_g15865 [Colletotrichum fructicola]|uniref:Chromo domain-containing protein n=1 Tax=Colletotrichum fructicola (strain Nara gc5) TaxID=1213859 RepID=A0A7J6IDF0_COLFN|nr:uncharacterized protein CGMCC3_g15865 [Colletotrichum fructicola]KAE9568056.1 hypothetical protein CGMCC3_g15865 [Colletotrichum fructicola]KAF4474367.1 hypothetical protein CGGC5_v016969 [Colletotrichum fructicola Nara gc5]KAF4880970.1 hypothetical protein CGCFRS4_v016024 [Colletotrichum fructicola]
MSLPSLLSVLSRVSLRKTPARPSTALSRDSSAVALSSASPEPNYPPQPPPPLVTSVAEADPDADFSDAAILDHNLDSETNRVTFDWKRAGVRERLVIAEVHAQLISQSKILDYWRKVHRMTGQVREEALRCELYHVFKILDHRRRRERSFLLVQWVGYSDDPGDTTWEPLGKIEEVAPVDVQEYLIKKRLWKNLRPWPAWKKKIQNDEDARLMLMTAPSFLEEANQRLRSESTTRLSADLGFEM